MKSFRPFLFFIILFAAWLFSSLLLIFKSDFSLSILSFNHQNDPRKTASFINEQLWKGEFVARENYLGIVSIHFEEGKKILQDTVTFRIREKGQEAWLAENTYDSRQFYNLENFPLGFPVIQDSKDKIFEFEFRSTTTNLEEVLFFESSEPIVETKYQFPKEILLKDISSLAAFSWKKLLFAFSLKEFKANTSHFLVAAGLYLMWLIFPKKASKKFLKKFIVKTKWKQLLTPFTPVLSGLFGFIFILLLIISILTFKNGSAVFSLVILGLWVYRIRRLRVHFGTHFMLALVLLLFLTLTSLLGLSSIAQRLAVWTYYFLCLGCFHALMELYVWKK